MINRVHSLFHRPEKGWDPLPADYASRYAENEWRNVDMALLGQLEQWIGGLKDKRILDLGGGPGQYSVAFAQRGARVTWHDVSRTYQTIASKRAAEAGVNLDFSLGYLENAQRFIGSPFDLVFVRLVWSYCRSDRAFAKLVYSLVKPGGAAYIDSHTPVFEEVRGIRRLSYFLNNYLGWKIGHPHPPHGRVARLLHSYPVDLMVLNYSSSLNDKIFIVKAKVAGT